MNNCDFSDSYEKLFKNKEALLPNLKFLIMEKNNKNKDNLKNLLLSLPIFFPKIEFAYIREESFIPVSLDVL
jgi:hypothetical protein